MAQKLSDDIVAHLVRDMVDAEHRMLETLPEMAREARSPDLREALESLRAETAEHVENLRRILGELDISLRPIAEVGLRRVPVRPRRVAIQGALADDRAHAEAPSPRGMH